MRVFIAKIFWFSGLTKLGNWQGTIALFTQDYKVPLLSPEFAAYLAASFELTCPILLLFGFATRFAALALLGMTAVIQYTYPGYIEHAYWALLLTTILFYGAGRLSLDHYLKNLFTQIYEKNNH
jgi:putative oxidoreductase